MKKVLALLMVAVMSCGIITAASVSATAQTKVVVVKKKDGTPDKRYKTKTVVVTHVKKDGTTDKRFKENKPVVKKEVVVKKVVVVKKK